MEAELRALREELTHRPSAKRPRSSSSSTEKLSDQATDWQNQSGNNNNNNDLPKPTNGGDHTLKVLSKSNGSSVENIEEKPELDPNPVASVKTELVDVGDAAVTDKENALVAENNE